MCNACGNLCCGSDEFGRCGCDACEEPACWSDDEEDGEDFALNEEIAMRCTSRACLCALESAPARLVATDCGGA